MNDYSGEVPVLATMEQAMTQNASERQGRARRTDAARNAERLVSAARELFAEAGPEVTLDEVAKRAGLGNATLYRHFPTRGDLLVAVYSDEVDALREHGDRLLAAAPADALFAWLDAFVTHVATKSELALAITEDPTDSRRTDLFHRWHESMRQTAKALLAQAKQTGAVRPDLEAADLLALTGAAALAADDAAHARRLVAVLRHGFAASPHSRN